MAEDAIANTRDEIIDGVTQWARHDCHERGRYLPDTAKAAKDIDKRVRAEQQISTSGKDQNAIGHAGLARRGYALTKCNPLEWSKLKGAFAIVPQNKFHRAMAKTTVTIVENGVDIRSHE